MIRPSSKKSTLVFVGSVENAVEASRENTLERSLGGENIINDVDVISRCCRWIKSIRFPKAFTEHIVLH